jgi:transcriptional regulator with PAS, ATPase and Fis domain
VASVAIVAVEWSLHGTVLPPAGYRTERFNVSTSCFTGDTGDGDEPRIRMSMADHDMDWGERLGDAYWRPVDELLGALGRVYIVANPELRVVEFSSSFPDTVGRTSTELLGVPLSELLGEELTGSQGVIREVLRTGHRREGLRAFLRVQGGDARAVSLTVGKFRDHQEQGSCVVLMMRGEQEDEAPVPSYGGIVARSAAMQRIFRLFELLRDHDSTVLITGESGTGKELVARAIHDTSYRSKEPFVAVNCAALPAELLESELFGHVRGAFTGAVKDRVGRFELADGGTLFLDEIGAMSLPLQAKILRAIQEQTFERVGDTRTRSVDVRLVAATNENLVRAVRENRFREDLYYRLRVVPIEIPPLRERREDIEAITRYLLHRIGDTRGRALRLSPTAMDALMGYAWPGNVRELENALEFATTVCEGQTIHVKHLPVEVRDAGFDGPHPSEPVGPAGAAGPGIHGGDEAGSGTGIPGGAPLPGTPGVDPRPVQTGPRAAAPGVPADLSPSEAAEAREILDALARTRYSRQDAAEILGISRTTLWRKMKQYRL